MSKRLTHEEFLEKLWENNECYRNGEFKVLGKYINSSFPILLKDKYGYLRVKPSNLYNNYKPIITSAIFKHNYFLRMLEDKNKYYKKVFYIVGKFLNAREKIKCMTKYGYIFLKYESLLKNKTFRYSCGFNEKFLINRFKEIHNNTYNYRLKGLKMFDKVSIECKKHGVFSQRIGSHLEGRGCPKCATEIQSKNQTRSHESFINAVRNIQKDKYDLSKVKYVDAKTKIILTCKLHGDFKVFPSAALRGGGCKDCALEGNNYNFNYWKNIRPKNKGILYLLEFFNEKERFLKIGITCVSVEDRYKLKMDYSFNKIIEIKSFDRRFIWDTEVYIKRKYKKHKFNPSSPFAGAKTEVFNYSKLEDIKNDLVNITNNPELLNQVFKNKNNAKKPSKRYLTKEQVIKIRGCKKYNGYLDDLAKTFKVSRSLIKSVRYKQSYKDW